MIWVEIQGHLEVGNLFLLRLCLLDSGKLELSILFGQCQFKELCIFLPRTVTSAINFFLVFMFCNNQFEIKLTISEQYIMCLNVHPLRPFSNSPLQLWPHAVQGFSRAYNAYEFIYLCSAQKTFLIIMSNVSSGCYAQGRK